MATGSYTTIWPIFGAANQLLAALALLAIAVWLKSANMDCGMVVVPMVFMFAVTLTALVQLIYSSIVGGNLLVASLSVFLFVLSLALAWEGYGVIMRKVVAKTRATVD